MEVKSANISDQLSRKKESGALSIVNKLPVNKRLTDGNYDRALAVKCVNGTFVGKKEESSMEKKILINGKIYTEDTRRPWAEAVAIDGRDLACV